MNKINETGHATNVANLFKLIAYVKGYGEAYNPSNPNLTVVALEKLAHESQFASLRVNDVLAPRNAAVAAREAAFKPLSALSTRLLNSVKSTTTLGAIDETARTFVRKIKGERASVVSKTDVPQDVSPEASGATQVSASQQSYDNLLFNFDKLIKHLKFTQQYSPNEKELQIASLEDMYNDLNAKNTAAVDAEVALSNARMARNKLIYAPLTGLADVALDTKNYVKSVFGPTSAEFKQISGLKFTQFKP